MTFSKLSKCVRLIVQKQYRSDLNWMKGVGWEASQSLDVQQAKKAGELVSEVRTIRIGHFTQSEISIIWFGPFILKLIALFRAKE